MTSKLIKGKKYVLFGNFNNAENLQKEFKETLGIDVVCIMNNVDTTVAMEYKDKENWFKRTLRKLVD